MVRRVNVAASLALLASFTIQGPATAREGPAPGPVVTHTASVAAPAGSTDFGSAFSLDDDGPGRDG